MKMSQEQQDFVDEVYRELNDYIDLYGNAVELRILNRRFGVRAKKLFGLTLRSVLVASKRFELITDNKFRTVVTVM